MTPQSGTVPGMGTQFSFRFSSPELREKCEARAAEKNISLNEWLNRAATHAATHGGKVRITTTQVAEV